MESSGSHTGVSQAVVAKTDASDIGPRRVLSPYVAHDLKLDVSYLEV